MTGMYLDPGEYDIDLKYQPPFFIIGIILFFLGLLDMGYISYKYKSKEFNSLLPSLSFKIPADKPIAIKSIQDKTGTKKAKSKKKKYKKRK